MLAEITQNKAAIPVSGRAGQRNTSPSSKRPERAAAETDSSSLSGTLQELKVPGPAHMVELPALQEDSADTQALEQMKGLRLGGILVNLGFLTKERLVETVSHQRKWGGLLGRLVIEKGFCTREQVDKAVAGQRGIEYRSLGDDFVPDKKALALLPALFCLTYRAFPVTFDEKENLLTVGVANGDKSPVTGFIEREFKCKVKPVFVPAEEVRAQLRKHVTAETNWAPLQEQPQGE